MKSRTKIPLHVGFTGTQRGMTFEQESDVEECLRELWEKDFRWAHHGDCVGADAQFHRLARRVGYQIHLHPPLDPSKRAFCDFDKQTEPRPYLERNKDIVHSVIRLIATPKSAEKELRSGTWSTIRFAKKNHVHTLTFVP